MMPDRLPEVYHRRDIIIPFCWANRSPILCSFREEWGQTCSLFKYLNLFFLKPRLQEEKNKLAIKTELVPALTSAVTLSETIITQGSMTFYTDFSVMCIFG